LLAECYNVAGGFAMPLSEAKKRSNKKWNDANMKERYDRIQLVVDKGEREKLSAHAEIKGESLSAFIKRAVYATMEIDKAEAELRAMLEQRE
jgi:uncharacterized protein (DUF1778 family)